MRSTIVCFLAIVAAMLLSPQDAQAKIACMAWCNKCAPGSAACAANCTERHQPEVNPSCDVRYSNSSVYAIKNGESIELLPVYWIASCKSLLKSFAGIDVMQGPPAITLSLKEGMVHASRQQCSNPIKGANVIATAKGITAPTEATLVFRVRYNTLDGPRQSTHTIQLKLFP